ncbi:Polycystin-2 [Symbiodinium microadriaticum]|uniref:Polycystin-2 n=1 Tax=Symbiodinium microadriaticum TaxID=2951 RepID=A0A1Q9EYQ0_SYMMI|nr:Polycystin-2 [Symbiodinium microadriaticum]
MSHPQAQDYKVQGFRLVGIFSKGSYDKEKFRSIQDFEQKYEKVSRVQDSYSLAQIHRSELMGKQWYEYHPTRVMDFRNISLTPKSYEQWMRKAVYEGEMRCVGKLEVDADNCIPDLRSDGDPFVREEWQLFTRSLSPTEALKLSARPETADLNTFFDQSPPAAAEGMTMGFIPKGTVPVETAVRFRTWNVGVMPNNHARIILQIPCYFDCFQNPVVKGSRILDCMGKLLQEQQVCYSFDGEETLQFVTYNGNMDMNVFTMGLTDFAEQRQNTNHALFITYVVAAVLFLILVLRDVLIQLQLTSLQKPWYMFILDFFLDDVWNFLDVIVLVVNGLVIDSIFRYMLIDGTFDLRNGFQSWTDNFVFLGTASLETQDAYEAFGKAAYDTFITLSSLNGLVLLLRFAKYFRSVSSLRLVLTTLTAALQELFMISALIIVVLVAVVLLMHNRFGVIFHRYGTLESSSQSVFFFLTGSFDTADLYGAFPIFFLLVTIFFQISFLLILNLLIAAIIFRWKDSRRDAEDFSVLSFWTTLRDNVNVFKGNKAGGRSHDERHLKKLDPSFWRNLAVLRHIDKLDESGKINFNADHRSESPKAKREEEENRERDDEEELVDLQAHVEKRWEQEMESEALGIVEDPQEIWLDALLTVLEDANALEKLQKLFLPRPMIEPKKAFGDLEIVATMACAVISIMWFVILRNTIIIGPRVERLHPDAFLFTWKKLILERRLNHFLRWLQEEARVKHYEYVREMAVSKEEEEEEEEEDQEADEEEKQSVTDYLQTLDVQQLGLKWFVELVIIVYIFSIAFTQLAQGTVMGSVYFPTVQHAMYSLLIYGTFLDDIAPFCDAVGAESVACLTLVFIFSILSACTVLNLLIGVLCEVVSQVAQNEKEDLMVQKVTMNLQILLQSLDVNNDGRISQAEFVQIMELPEAVLALEEVGIDPVSIVDFTEYIFGGEDNSEDALNFSNFMEVILKLRQTNECTIRDMVDLRRHISSQLTMAQDVVLDHLREHGERQAKRRHASPTSPQHNSGVNKDFHLFTSSDASGTAGTGSTIDRQPVPSLHALQARTAKLEHMMKEALAEVDRLLHEPSKPSPSDQEAGGEDGELSPSLAAVRTATARFEISVEISASSGSTQENWELAECDSGIRDAC